MQPHATVCKMVAPVSEGWRRLCPELQGADRGEGLPKIHGLHPHPCVEVGPPTAKIIPLSGAEATGTLMQPHRTEGRKGPLGIGKGWDSPSGTEGVRATSHLPVITPTAPGTFHEVKVGSCMGMSMTGETQGA